jgi:hypothetical protein
VREVVDVSFCYSGAEMRNLNARKADSCRKEVALHSVAPPKNKKRRVGAARAINSQPDWRLGERTQERLRESAGGPTESERDEGDVWEL